MSDRTTTSRSKAAVKAKAAATAPQSDKAVAALEAKLAALEAKVAEQETLLAQLQSRPSGGGLSEEVLAELRRYFATAPSTKVPTHWPKL